MELTHAVFVIFIAATSAQREYQEGDEHSHFSRFHDSSKEIFKS